MWTIWNKETEINGFSAEAFLARNKHLQNEETIFIKTVNGRVTQVEGKGILAEHYGIDPTLPDEEFIAAYEAILNQPTDPDEISDEEALAIIRGETV
jgi:hypothetical protein